MRKQGIPAKISYVIFLTNLLTDESSHEPICAIPGMNYFLHKAENGHIGAHICKVECVKTSKYFVKILEL